MITDFHSHFFPDSIAENAVSTIKEISEGELIAHTDGKLSGLINELSSSNVSRAVTLPVATKKEQVYSINRSLPLNNNKIIPFGAIHPECDYENEINYLKSIGIKGLKIHPEYQDIYINDKKYEKFFRAIENSNLILLMHTGYDPGPFTRDHCEPKMVLEFIEKYSKITLVAAHFGGLLMWADVYKYLAGKNLYLDTSAIFPTIDKDLFLKICRKHKTDKILFGSDSPWFSINDSINFIRNSGLNSNEIEDILYNSSVKLIGDFSA